MIRRKQRVDARPQEGKGPFVIAGYQAVKEALVQNLLRVEEVWTASGRGSSRDKEIQALSREKGIPVLTRQMADIESALADINHQGFAAFVREFRYAELEDIAGKEAGDLGRRIIIAADHITDEGNLGAIIRTAAFFGAQGLIIPKDRSASVTPLVFRRSSGGCVYLPVAMVVNLERSLNYLKDEGFWIIGAAGEAATSIYDFDWDRDIVLALGNEEKGLTQAVRKRCDALVSIPVQGRVSSLNVSVASGILLSHLQGRPLHLHI